MFSSVEQEQQSIHNSASEPVIEKIQALLAQATAEEVISGNQAYTLAQEAHALAIRINATPLIIKAKIQSARGLYLQSDLKNALTEITAALDLAERHQVPEQAAEAHLVFGLIYDQVGIYAESMDHLLQAYHYYKEKGDQEKIAENYMIIGLNYARQQNYTEAERYILLAFAILEPLSHQITSRSWCDILFLLGSLKNAQNQPEQALEFCNRLLEFAEKREIHVGVSNAWADIGQAHQSLKHSEAVLPAYMNALAAAQRGTMQTQVAYVYMLLGKYHYEEGHYEDAIVALLECAAISERANSVRRAREVYDLLPKVYMATGQYHEAALAYETGLNLREKIEAEQQNIRFTIFQTMFSLERARNEATAATLKASQLLQDIEQRDRKISELDSFARSVAHDLKNPLNIVQNYTLMLEDDLRKHLTPLNSEMFTIVLDETKRMAGIVTTMLEVARSQREEVEAQPVEMSMVVRSVIRRIKTLATQYHAEISVETSLPMALGLPGWLEEVWFNYLSNAMKYGGKPPHIRIGANEEGAQVRYWVRDNGNGISETDQQRLFREFTRVGSHRVEGHGVGLSIVKTIVEKLNGAIGVESTGKPGEGTTFSFTLPALAISEFNA